MGGALVELGPLAPRSALVLAFGAVLAAAAVGSVRTLRASYPAAIAAFAIANWVLDCVALDLALRAVGADPSLGTLVPAYALAQVVAAVPLLPGGGGTVEASLASALASFGHTAPAIIAGVVPYRLISNWGLVPIGWAAIVVGSSAHVDRGGGAAMPHPPPAPAYQAEGGGGGTTGGRSSHVIVFGAPTARATGRWSRRRRCRRDRARTPSPPA